MMGTAPAPRRLGKTEVQVPAVIFGTSALGNLYRETPVQSKVGIVAEIFRQSPAPVVFDTAGKYGAGLALEMIGFSLRELGIKPTEVVISNKLGWYRVPLRGPEPTFERGVWAGIQHDAEARISYQGIKDCYEQGCELLGGAYRTQVVSVHDPDEYLAAASSPKERARRFEEVLGAYQALFELKAQGAVAAVGVGSKDWRVIREIAGQIDLDWVMLACSLTVYTHPAELLEFIGELRAREVGMINSAVFNAGFLIGGEWFNYRRPDPAKDAGLFDWRVRFLRVCRELGAEPAQVCIQFGLAVPGIVAVALNAADPHQVTANLKSAARPVSAEVWRTLEDEGLIARTLGVG